ncbi:DOMON domain-containing protein [Qipengyuania sp. CAU 1752]
MHELVLHPDCAVGPIQRVHAKIEPTSQGCRAVFELDGNVEDITIPAKAASERTDNLWKTTCFEIFWQPVGDSDYREFNLSPSSRWAAYDFDDFRENARDAPVDAVAIASEHDGDKLTLKADILAELPLPAQVALNAIIEDEAGNIQYWALAFAAGKPEFHSEACRTLTLETRP